MKYLATLLSLLAAPAWSASPLDGTWASDAESCKTVFLALQASGSFENRLGDEPRKGRFRVLPDRLVLRFEDGDEQVMPIMDQTANRLVLFDETTEGDRRFVRCP